MFHGIAYLTPTNPLICRWEWLGLTSVHGSQSNGQRFVACSDIAFAKVACGGRFRPRGGSSSLGIHFFSFQDPRTRVDVFFFLRTIGAAVHPLVPFEKKLSVFVPRVVSSVNVSFSFEI